MPKWICSAMLVLAACGNSRDEGKPKDNHKAEDPIDHAIGLVGPKVNPKLDKLHSIASQLGTLDPKQAYAGPKLAIASNYHDKPVGNAVLIYAVDLPVLDTLAWAPLVPYRHPHAGEVASCYWAVRKKTFGAYATYDGKVEEFKLESLNPLQVADQCDNLARSTYVVVIDQNNVEEAHSVTTGSPKTFGKGTFRGGATAGTLWIFDLDNGAYLGARTYDAKSSETIKYTVDVDKDGNTKPGIQAPNAVDADLRGTTQYAIDVAIANL